MANYYVSANTGSDSTGDGLSPSTAWKTIGKAIGASPAITLSGSGDTLYIAPGVYREVVTLGLSPTAAGPLAIVGDPTGAVFGVAPGLVDWRGWSTDTTALTTACLSAAGKSYVTLRMLHFIGGAATGIATCVYVNGAQTNWTFEDCVFIAHASSGYAVWYQGTQAVAQNLTVRRCQFVSSGTVGVGFDLRAAASTSEYALSALVENCSFTAFWLGTGVRLVTSGGSGSFSATGLTIQNCEGVFVGTFANIHASSASATLATPVGVYGCKIIAGTGITAKNTTCVVEDGNHYFCGTNLSNVTAGSNSTPVACPAIDFGTGRLTGLPLRPYGEPFAVSTFLSSGNYGSTPTVDLWNQTRPAKASAGALEIETLPGGGGGSTYIFQVEG
jgi:hypothetical protein